MLEKVPAILKKRRPQDNQADLLVYLEDYNKKEHEFEITVPYNLVKDFSWGESIMLHLDQDQKIKKVVRRHTRTKTEINNWPQLQKTQAEIENILKALEEKIKE